MAGEIMGYGGVMGVEDYIDMLGGLSDDERNAVLGALQNPNMARAVAARARAGRQAKAAELLQEAAPGVAGPSLKRLGFPIAMPQLGAAGLVSAGAAQPQKAIRLEKLIIVEIPSAAAAPGVSAITQLTCNNENLFVVPIPGAGVAIATFGPAVLENSFRAFVARPGSTVNITIVRNVVPGVGQTVDYSVLFMGEAVSG